MICNVVQVEKSFIKNMSVFKFSLTCLCLGYAIVYEGKCQMYPSRGENPFSMQRESYLASILCIEAEGCLYVDMDGLTLSILCHLVGASSNIAPVLMSILLRVRMSSFLFHRSTKRTLLDRLRAVCSSTFLFAFRHLFVLLQGQKSSMHFC